MIIDSLTGALLETAARSATSQADEQWHCSESENQSQRFKGRNRIYICCFHIFYFCFFPKLFFVSKAALLFRDIHNNRHFNPGL